MTRKALFNFIQTDKEDYLTISVGSFFYHVNDKLKEDRLQMFLKVPFTHSFNLSPENLLEMESNVCKQESSL